MLFSVTAEEIRSAPNEVQNWFFGHLGLRPEGKKSQTSKTDDTGAKPKAKATTTEAELVIEVPANAEPPSMDALLAQALAFISRKGQGELVALLNKYGAKKVSDLPADKRAAFLVEVAIDG